jgi:hypothetical protein
MRMLVTVLSLSILAACRVKEAPAAHVNDGRFHPPADGRLSPGQIQSYLDVQDKLKAKNGTSDDVSTAKELGFDADEYGWVKARILEASNSETAAREIRERLARSDGWTKAGVEFSREEIQQALDQAKDDQTRRYYTEMLANHDSKKAEWMKDAAAGESPVAYNRNILSPYRCKPSDQVDKPAPDPCVVMKTFE